MGTARTRGSGGSGGRARGLLRGPTSPTSASTRCHAPAAPVAARHAGGCPPCASLDVDEHQPVGIEAELVLEPFFTPGQDVGAVLLGGVRGLFLCVMACRGKKRWIVPKPKADPAAPGSRELLTIRRGAEVRLVRRPF